MPLLGDHLRAVTVCDPSTCAKVNAAGGGKRRVDRDTTRIVTEVSDDG